MGIQISGLHHKWNLQLILYGAAPSVYERKGRYGSHIDPSTGFDEVPFPLKTEANTRIPSEDLGQISRESFAKMW